MINKIYIVILLATFSLTSYSAEVETKPTKPSDWRKVERQLYQRNTLTLTGPQMIAAMPSVITFAESAKHNIANELSDEYKTIFERNALYDLVSLVIEHDKNTKKKKRSVKFFHAATVVTARVPLGIVDIFDDTICSALTPEVREFLRHVNGQLLGHNIPTIKKLLLDWDHPRHPITEADQEISGWEFDLAMVDSEQGKVEQLISSYSLSDETKSNLNVVSAGCNWLGKLAVRYTPVDEAQKWLNNVGYSPFDFFNLEHRKAVGKAIVTMFHKKSESDFRKAIGL